MPVEGGGVHSQCILHQLFTERCHQRRKPCVALLHGDYSLSVRYFCRRVHLRINGSALRQTGPLRWPDIPEGVCPGIRTQKFGEVAILVSQNGGGAAQIRDLERRRPSATRVAETLTLLETLPSCAARRWPLGHACSLRCPSMPVTLSSCSASSFCRVTTWKIPAGRLAAILHKTCAPRIQTVRHPGDHPVFIRVGLAARSHLTSSFGLFARILGRQFSSKRWAAARPEAGNRRISSAWRLTR